MTSRTIDLSGLYMIQAVDADSITLVDPSAVNPAWAYADLDGAGTTGYDQSITMVLSKAPDLNLAGTYEVDTVSATEITLVDAAGVNADWSSLGLYPGGATRLLSSFVAKSEGNWIGPFIVPGADTSLLVANFVAAAGLYKDSSKKQTAFPITVELEATPVDTNDDPTGSPETFTTTIPGNASGHELRAVTLVCELSTPGRQSVRARRTTPADYNFKGQVVDEISWRDLYGVSQVDVPDFGDVTTVHSRTYATVGATSVKDRKLNLQARRCLPERVSGSEFTTGLVGTDRVDAILSAICLDPYIGRYNPDAVDFDNIYDTVQEVEDYFGSELAVEFGFTFDDDNVSFEETLATVANCAFCAAYRQGTLIRVTFERARDGGVLLFNHRNILPGTQHRSVTFGVADDHDGVEFDWTAAKDGAKLTYDIPYDHSSLAPRKVEVPGVRSGALAYWHSWRAWNKLKYQSSSLEQEATQEAALVLPRDRVLITDQTRPPGFEGDVLSADGLDLELSQPVEFADGLDHTMFIQHVDATVEALPVGPWVPPTGEEPDPYRVTLGTAPRLDLALGEGLSMRPTYEIVVATDKRSRAWLVTEREPNSNFTETVRAINYSPLYYINDETVLWLPLTEASFRDQSPWQRDGSPVGSADIVEDDDRGKLVYEALSTGGAVDFAAFTPPDSYSKAAWVLAGAGSVLASDGETFGLEGGDLVAGHPAVAVSAPVPSDGEWHHVAVTYDDDTGSMALFVDGSLVDETSAGAVVRGSKGQLSAFGDLVGRADDLRLWKKALSSAEVLALYRSTRRPFP